MESHDFTEDKIQEFCKNLKFRNDDINHAVPDALALTFNGFSSNKAFCPFQNKAYEFAIEFAKKTQDLKEKKENDDKPKEKKVNYYNFSEEEFETGLCASFGGTNIDKVKINLTPTFKEVLNYTISRVNIKKKNNPVMHCSQKLELCRFYRKRINRILNDRFLFYYKKTQEIKLYKTNIEPIEKFTNKNIQKAIEDSYQYKDSFLIPLYDVIQRLGRDLTNDEIYKFMDLLIDHIKTKYESNVITNTEKIINSYCRGNCYRGLYQHEFMTYIRDYKIRYILEHKKIVPKLTHENLEKIDNSIKSLSKYDDLECVLSDNNIEKYMAIHLKFSNYILEREKPDNVEISARMVIEALKFFRDKSGQLILNLFDFIFKRPLNNYEVMFITNICLCYKSLYTQYLKTMVISQKTKKEEYIKPKKPKRKVNPKRYPQRSIQTKTQNTVQSNYPRRLPQSRQYMSSSGVMGAGQEYGYDHHGGIEYHAGNAFNIGCTIC